MKWITHLLVFFNYEPFERPALTPKLRHEINNLNSIVDFV
jgi:hypothetical protein